MTQNEKELLIKDICGRLPYGVLIQEDYTIGDEMFLPIAETDRLVAIDVDAELLMTNGGSKYHIDEFKLYLFPLSSMTEEQRKEYEEALVYHEYTNGGWTIAKTFDDEYIIPYWFVDFCNKNHIDYRGLIPMGLAIDATNLNLY